MAKQEKKIEVMIVFRKKQATVIEFSDKSGMPCRLSLPSEMIRESPDGKVYFTEDELSIYGIPYGIPWEHLLKEIIISPEKLAGELRRNGIWTRDDVYKKPDGVKGALFASLSTPMASIIKIAKESIPTEEN